MNTLWHKIAEARISRPLERLKKMLEKPKYRYDESGLIFCADTGDVIGDWKGSPRTPNHGQKYEPAEIEGLSPHKLKKLARVARRFRKLEEEMAADE